MIRKNGEMASRCSRLKPRMNLGRRSRQEKRWNCSEESADQLGMMEDDTITWAEAKAARDDPSD